MKNMQKILSIILCICMTLQLLPVFAQETGTEGANANELVYIINDNFETEKDVSEWKHVAVTDTEKYQGTVEQIPANAEGGVGVGALKITTGATPGATDNGQQAGAYKALAEPITFTEGKKVIIKTKVMHTSDSARFYMKANRPDSTDLPMRECGNALYTLFNVQKTDGLNRSNGIQGTLTEEKDSQQWLGSNVVKAGLQNKWIEAEMVMYKSDGVDMIDYTFNIQGASKNPYKSTGSFVQPKRVYTHKYGDATTKTSFDALESLSFVFRDAADTLYVDYVQVYEIAEVTPAVEKNVIYPDENIVLSLDSNTVEFPDGSVILSDKNGEAVEARVSYNKNARTITIDPTDMLTAKTSYNVDIDTSLISANSKVYATSFKVNVVPEAPVGMIVNQQFNKDGDEEGWIPGDAKDGFEATVTQTTKDDLGVLAVTASSSMDGSSSADGNGMSAVHFDMPEDIVFREDSDIIIKTRFKHEVPEGADRSEVSFKYNRPNDVVALDQYDCGHYLGVLFTGHTGNVLVKDGQQGSAPLQDKTTNILANASGKWLDLEMKLNFAKATAEYAIWETDKKDTTKVSLQGDLTTRLPADALESLAVLFRKTGSAIYFDYITVEETRDIVMLVDGSYKKDEPVTVTFDTAKGATELKDAVKLYDAAGKIVNTVNTIDTDKKIVTLSPENGLAEGGYYTVKFDTEKYPAYNIDIAEKEFYVSDKKYILYSDFEKSGYTGTWKHVAVTDAAKYQGTVEQIPADAEGGVGVGALKIATGATPGATGNGQQAGVHKALSTPVELTADKRVIIKTKVMHTSDSARFYMKANRPDSTDLPASECGSNLYTMFNVLKTTALNRSNGITGELTETSDSQQSSLSAVVSGSLKNKWIEAEMVMYKSGGVDMIDYTFNIQGASKNPYVSTGSFAQPTRVYTHKYGDDTTKTSFDALESLSFVFREAADELYIDYVEIYEEAEVTPVLKSKGVYADDNIVLTFDGDAKLSDNSAVLYDASNNAVNTTASYDSNNCVLTVDPADELTPKSSYKLVIDPSKADPNVKLLETEFGIVVVPEAPAGVIVNQQFNTDGDEEGWIPGDANDGFEATVTQTTKDDYGVLAVTASSLMDGSSSADGNGMSAAHLDLTDDVALYRDDANIVIKTRFKHEIPSGASDSRVSFKYNRPNDVAALDTYDCGHNLGVIFAGNTGTIAIKDGQQGTPAIQDKTTNILANASGKWLDLEMNLDFADNKATYAIWETGKKDTTKITKTGTLTTKIPNDLLESFAILFRKTGSTIYFDYITVEEVLEGTPSLAIDAASVLGNADIGAHIVGMGGRVADFSDAVTLVDKDNNEIEVQKSFTSMPVSEFDNKTDYKVVLNPENDLQPGTYTVKFDSDKLSAIGVNVTGTTEFAFEVINSTEVDINFENETADAEPANGWSFREDALDGSKSAKVITDENGNKFLRINATGRIPKGNGNIVTYSKNLSDAPFVRDMKKNTVVEMKLRTNLNTVRKYVKLNYPAEQGTIIDSSKSLYDNCYNEAAWNTRLITTLNKGDLGTTYDDYYFTDDSKDYSNRFQGKGMNVSKYNCEQWYTVKTVYNNSDDTASTYVYDEAGAEVGRSEDNALTAWWFNYADFNRTKPQVMHTIEDITFQFRPEGEYADIVDEQLDIDDIKIYNAVNAFENFSVLIKSGGKVITEPAKNTTVVPEFNLYKRDGEESAYTLISAMYVDGVLDEMHVKELTTTGATYTEPDGYVLGDDVSDIVIKAFIWSGNNSMIPLCEPAVVSNPETTKVYVETAGDDETGTGALNAPVASVTKALELTKGIDGPSEIVIGGGNYYLSDTIAVDEENEGVIISAAKGEQPALIGGVAINIGDESKVKKVENTSEIWYKLSHHENQSEIAERLYEVDLTGVSIPDVNLPGTYSYAAEGLAMPNDTVFHIDEPQKSTCEVFVNGKAMTVARYPNETYTTVSKVVQEGAITRNWMSDKVNGTDYVEVAERVATPFIIEEERATYWSDAHEALAFGYWKQDWATQTVPVTISGNKITSIYPSHYGVAEGQRFYVYNLLEEIDAPGEYYIDRTNNKMYIYLPEDATTDDDIVISLSDINLMTITADNVIVNGLKLTASRGLGIDADANNVIIKKCEISNTADLAVDLTGDGNIVKDCIIHDVNGGVLVQGGNNNYLTDGNSKILNNKIERFARIDKVYTYAVEVRGRGNFVSHNEISDSEHSAIGFRGTNHEISYNDISNVCKEVDDAGAIYSGRTWISRDNKILYNYIHDIKSNVKQVNGVAGVFIDDHFADIHIEGNVFANITGEGVRTNKGRENVITNNIFVNCSGYGTKITSEDNPSERDYSKHINEVNAYIKNSLWKKEYSILFTTDGTGATVANTSELIYSNDNEYTKNLAVMCGTPYVIGAYATTNGLVDNNKDVSADPGFADMAKGDYSISAEAVQALGIAGFASVPFAEMGRK